jgi:hypothetical protein
VEVGKGINWTLSGFYADELSVVDDFAYSGNSSLYIKTSPNGKEMQGGIFFRTIYPDEKLWGKELQLEAKLFKNLKDRAYVAFEVNALIPGQDMSSEVYEMRQDAKSGSWESVAKRFLIPEGAKELNINGYLMGIGEAWFDDVKIQIDGEIYSFDVKVEIDISKAESLKDYITEVKQGRYEYIDKLGGARLVGIGESTHGTKEFSIEKFKLAMYLNKIFDFEYVIIEDKEKVAEMLNKYLHDGGVSIDDLMSKFNYAYKKEIVRDVLIEYKEDLARIHFVGCQPNEKDSLSEDSELCKWNICKKYMEQHPKGRFALLIHSRHLMPDMMGGYISKELGESFKSISMITCDGRFEALTQLGNKTIEFDSIREEAISNGILQSSIGEKAFMYVGDGVNVDADNYLTQFYLVRNEGYAKMNNDDQYIPLNVLNDFDGYLYFKRTSSSNFLK